MTIPTRPDCFEFAMSFLGDPEETVLRGYIEALEARAALAQPEPVGPTLDDIVELCADHEFTLGVDGANEEESAKGLLEIARAVLARWGHPTPQPIPVSERLPGAEDCNDKGECWWFSPEVPRDYQADLWGLYAKRDEEDTHWLPFHALPLPTTEP